MQIIHFVEGQKPKELETIKRLPDEGYVWLDFVRDNAPDWPRVVRELAGRPVYEAHVIDSLNLMHPSFFDGTEHYEMLIFRGLASTRDVQRFETRPSAYFLFDRLLVSVRPHDGKSVRLVAKRLFEGVARVPRRPAGLLLQILSAMVDRFLALRDPLIEQLEHWQTALLDPHDPFDDWMALMTHRNKLRRLERLCDEQLDAVSVWREESNVELDETLTVRTNDLVEHVRRVLHQAQHMQAQLESLVQIHFAAVAHRTNEIMRVLTVIAAIFLPLTLVAGVFGMNFEYMPELKWRPAYFVVLGMMIGIGIGMVVFFRRKRWI